MNKILQFFTECYKSTKWFILCFLTKDCPYSLKKLLAILSFFIAAFLAVFTQKLDMLIAMLGFISALLGLQSIDKYNYRKNNNTQNLG
jgi:hypothetical protein